MGYVICNSVGKCEECPNCGASKPHYHTSCEPCPFVRDAKCIPIDRVIGCKFCIEKDKCSSNLQKVIDCYKRREEFPISFPLLIDAPEEPIITAFEFHRLSSYGLSCFKCSYPIVFETGEEYMSMYLSGSGSAWDVYMDMNLDIEEDDSIIKMENKSAELLIYSIPNNHKVIEKINKEYSHLILIK